VLVGHLIFQYHLLKKEEEEEDLGTLSVCVCVCVCVHPCVCMHAHVLGPVYLGVKLGFLDSSVTDLSHCFMLCWQHDKIPGKKDEERLRVFLILVIRILFSKSGSSLYTECNDVMN